MVDNLGSLNSKQIISPALNNVLTKQQNTGNTAPSNNNGLTNQTAQLSLQKDSFLSSKQKIKVGVGAFLGALVNGASQKVQMSKSLQEAYDNIDTEKVNEQAFLELKNNILNVIEKVKNNEALNPKETEIAKAFNLDTPFVQIFNKEIWDSYYKINNAQNVAELKTFSQSAFGLRFLEIPSIVEDRIKGFWEAQNLNTNDGAGFSKDDNDKLLNILGDDFKNIYNSAIEEDLNRQIKNGVENPLAPKNIKKAWHNIKMQVKDGTCCEGRSTEKGALYSYAEHSNSIKNNQADFIDGSMKNLFNEMLENVKKQIKSEVNITGKVAKSAGIGALIIGGACLIGSVIHNKINKNKQKQNNI